MHIVSIDNTLPNLMSWPPISLKLTGGIFSIKGKYSRGNFKTTGN